MSDDINYHFPDFLLANQSKNVFAKHAVDLANKCVPLKNSTTSLFQIFYIIKHKKTIEKLSVLYYNRDKERVDRI